MIEPCPICQRQFCIYCGIRFPVSGDRWHFHSGTDVAAFRHCGVHDEHGDMAGHFVFQPTGLSAALQALSAEMKKLGIPVDYAGYYGLYLGFRGVDAIKAAVGETCYLKPLPDDPLWSPHQRGELLGFRLIEDTP